MSAGEVRDCRSTAGCYSPLLSACGCSQRLERTGSCESGRGVFCSMPKMRSGWCSHRAILTTALLLTLHDLTWMPCWSCYVGHSPLHNHNGASQLVTLSSVCLLGCVRAHRFAAPVSSLPSSLNQGQQLPDHILWVDVYASRQELQSLSKIQLFFNITLSSQPLSHFTQVALSTKSCDCTSVFPNVAPGAAAFGKRLCS